MNHEAPAISTVKPNGHKARERIMQAAIELFSRQGYDATPVREIVREAGVTKPVLYYYFKNKDDLFQQVIADLLDNFAGRLQAICDATAGDFKGQLCRIADLYFEGARTQPHVVRFVHSIHFSGLFERLFDFRSFWREEIEMIISVFERARGLGLIRQDLPAAVMANYFMGVVLHWMMGMVYDVDKMARDFDAEMIIPLVMEGIAPARPVPPDGVR
ncbi:MAG: TetR/AcrR family transcriptional regulator [bacterium]|nr:TetR/AcrR family transcriptional regulator [bacterium]